MRDALIAGTTLNIFNNHSDRVRGANLAQSINVLQSLILTKGRQMVLTPTYHVFDLYKVHQDAKYLSVQFTSPYYSLGDQKISSLNASASSGSAARRQSSSRIVTSNLTFGSATNWRATSVHAVSPGITSRKNAMGRCKMRT